MLTLPRKYLADRLRDGSRKRHGTEIQPLIRSLTDLANMNGTPRPIGNLINTERTRPLLQQMDAHRRLLDRIRQVLPQPLRDHCCDCCHRREALILFTDSPVWASQLRFHAPTMLGTLSITELSIRELYIHTLPSLHLPQRRSKPSRFPSRNIVQLLKTSASNSPSAEIGEALSRLGATLERRMCTADATSD
jgi:hypothetical protein